ncbi:MAG: LPS export ABC transporter permease LptG [Thiotrichaceae bacterium]|nr:LPS export ABC transporter permease LptG [Thiotrichaceae bacterium]
MSILARYLWKNALSGVILAWLALVFLDTFFALIAELDSTDGKNYGTPEAILYIIYSLPQRFYEYFPTSVLVGTLLGLGRLSANAEFTAMRAAGISIVSIAFSVLQLGVFLAFISFALGEWVVPETDRYANNFKASQKHGNLKISLAHGLWVKEKQKIIRIQHVDTPYKLRDIQIFHLKENHKTIANLSVIKSAEYIDKQWRLQGITRYEFKFNQVNKNFVKRAYTQILVKPEVLKVTIAKAQYLPSTKLKKIIEHQQSNNLNADKYELAYWKHFSTPLAALVMLLLAMPFLFSAQRSTNIGQRLFIGIIVGIIFHLLNSVINEMGVVYHLPAVVSAFLPVTFFLLISLISLYRVK